MLNFDKYLMRLGEPGVQAIIEQIERREGIRHGDAPLDLEVRWNAVMNSLPQYQQAAA